MQSKAVTVSSNFKRITVKAILSIVLFIVTYLLLITLALGITLLAAFVGIMLIAMKPMIITIMIGVGLVSMGGFVLIFMVKFISKKHTVDRSHLIEIKKEKEPELFAFINTIVKEINTDFPKRIYLSAEVNACVFYDSSFWSMFFPIKKNLQIGLGLVNTISAIEFKAILSHEFGHFSQRTMKVGSYVYNVNQIIYNMLYDNESYDSLAQKWANVSGYFLFFVRISNKIVRGIQWILKKVYEVVNLSYMGLSREMEFYADQVAANVTGSKPLIDSLLRMDLADHSYNKVLDYYNSTIKESIKTTNIYPQQEYVLNFIAKENDLPYENNLPQISNEYLSRFNKSKLNIEDQWASHPSTADRIRELKKLNIEKETENQKAASSLFNNVYETQSKVTEKLFSAITYEGSIININNEQFIEEYTTNYNANAIIRYFNDYYAIKNPTQIDVENYSPSNSDLDTNSNILFSNKAVDLVYLSISLESDIKTLNQIADKKFKIKSFYYDGVKYPASGSVQLIPKLEAELQDIKEKIHENDVAIFRYYLTLAKRVDKEIEFKTRYQAFIELVKDFNYKNDISSKMDNVTNFIHVTTPYAIIEQNINTLKTIEIEFKRQINDMLTSNAYQSQLTPEIKDKFTKYTAEDWIYFYRNIYDNDALNVMFTSINNFQFILVITYFNQKKDLLEYIENLNRGIEFL